MDEHGIVTALPRAGLATVSIERSPACEGCRSCCRGVGEAMVVEANDPLGVAMGERVLITVPPAAVLKASLAVYVLPLLVLLVVGSLAKLLAASLFPGRDVQLAAILSGFGGMILAYYLLQRFFGKRAEEALRPTIVSRD
jgi:sigma-E factor negative regulatory protein RseC